MLVNFTYKNYKSYYDEALLSLEVSPDKSLVDFNTFKPNDNRANEHPALLKSAFIFGPTSSGKSNIISALEFMKLVVTHSSDSDKVNLVKENKPFLFYKDAASEESSFEVEFISNYKFYRYGFILLGGMITKEYLEGVNKRVVTLFKRENNALKIKGLTSKDTHSILLKSKDLFISTASSSSLPIKEDINNVLSWFNSLTIVSSPLDKPLDIYTLNPSYLDKAFNIISHFDKSLFSLSIEKTLLGNRGDDPIKLMPKKQSSFNIFDINGDIYDIDIIASYHTYDNKDHHKELDNKDISLYSDKGYNSLGLESLLTKLGYIISSLEEGKVLVMDSFDTDIDYLVSKYLMDLYNSIDKNGKNAQLIAACTNPYLMDNNLRRDQIYFTSKDNFGASTLLSLSDFKDVRKTDLFAKKYLAGFYVDVPDFNDGI